MTAAFKFSTFEVTKQVFFRSKLSFGIVNLKPIVDNHVLVVPKRLVKRFADLTPEECADLFVSVRDVGREIERATNAKSLTIACQDGVYAGQSVPHLHVHILPRHPGDFEPADKVYDHLNNVNISADLQNATKFKVDSERHARSEDEMIKEATWLATLFPNNQS
ncbi:Dinucleoside triphosphate hydrolase [Cystobasidiomycetes sp. EMM_F5]